jgi:uncharacterized membrane protein YdbT with pleckstrin-like domain
MYPQKHFSGQHPDEAILHIVHRHWWNIASHFFMLSMTTSLFFGSIFIAPLFLETAGVTIDQDLSNFATSVSLLFLWIYIFLIWIDYYFDVWIITTERIINIEQRGLFKRVISELDLSRIQDVTSDVTGFFPTLLDYGDVFVQTAGQIDHFVFRNIPEPGLYKDRIMLLTKKTLSGKKNVSES